MSLLELLSGPPDISSGDFVLVSQVKNESLRLPFFLAHYAALGVTKFIIIDNCSTDGSAELALSHRNTTVYRNNDKYGGIWSVAKPLFERYCQDTWCLLVDADEILVYRDFERVSLPQFASALSREGGNGLRCLMLDMYSALPLGRIDYAKGSSLFDACPYFDPPTFLDDGRLFLGGARGRAFGVYPHALKTPVFRYHSGVDSPAFNSVHDLTGVKTSPLNGILCHFKYLPDLIDRSSQIAKEGLYWKESAEYKPLVGRVGPDSVFMTHRSKAYTGSGSFDELGMFELFSRRRNARLGEEDSKT